MVSIINACVNNLLLFDTLWVMLGIRDAEEILGRREGDRVGLGIDLSCLDVAWMFAAYPVLMPECLYRTV